MFISHARNCASGVFRKGLCLISYVIVCLFVFYAAGAAADVGGMVVVVLCLQCFLASDNPPAPHLTTLIVCV